MQMISVFGICLLICGCGLMMPNSDKSKSPTSVNGFRGKRVNGTVAGDDDPSKVGSEAIPQGDPGTCVGIENAEAKLRQTFYPDTPDVACKVDADCVIGVPGQHVGIGDAMSEEAAEKRASGEKIYEASDELKKLQSEYQAQNCIRATGVQTMQLVLQSRCEKDVCMGLAVVSCTYATHAADKASVYCVQYAGLSADQATAANATCTKASAGDVTTTWSERDACAVEKLLGTCRFPAAGADPASDIYYYSPGFDAASAEAACKAGDGQHEKGAWQVQGSGS